MAVAKDMINMKAVRATGGIILTNKLSRLLARNSIGLEDIA